MRSEGNTEYFLPNLRPLVFIRTIHQIALTSLHVFSTGPGENVFIFLKTC